jgi:glutamyl-tRNA reductase
MERSAPAREEVQERRYGMPRRCLNRRRRIDGGLALHILCTGVSFRSAPVEFREYLAFPEDRLRPALSALHGLPGVSQAAILSTCNRTEVYVVAAPEARAAVRAWLLAEAGEAAEMLRPHFYELEGRDAAAHLCRVAAGLDSQMIGESEILSQVRAALRAAKAEGTIGAALERIFTSAVGAGKRVRDETRISRGAFSVGRCAVETAQQKLGTLEGRTFLLIGAGKVAEAAARHLCAKGADTILVANRTYSKAQELAGQLGGRALRYDQLTEGLQHADIVISSTAAPHFVLLPDQIEEAMRRRDGRELLLIDIAVPRDIDPQVASIPGVHVFDIDDLCCNLQEATANRASEVEAAETIVGEATSELWQWLVARQVRPLLEALRGRLEEAHQEHVARFLPKLERLSPDDRAWVEDLVATLARRFLHEATVSLKEELAAGNGRLEHSRGAAAPVAVQAGHSSPGNGRSH